MQKNLNRLLYSSRKVAEEALRRGYKLDFFWLTPTSYSCIIRGEKNGKEVFFKSSTPASSSVIGEIMTENKIYTNDMLNRCKISTPKTVVYYGEDDFEKTEKLMEKYKTLVVKPSDTNHGIGITTKVSDRKSLKKAIKKAQKDGNGEAVLIQQQVEGDEYRFLVVGGKTVGVTHREPAFVDGDGVRTVKELIEEKNQDERRGVWYEKSLHVIDLKRAKKHIGGRVLKSVPVKDQRIHLSHVSNISFGGESFDFTDKASKELKQIAEKIAEICCLSVVGVDIMTKDISGGAKGSFVIEMNCFPGIMLHQEPAHGKTRDVAKLIFDEIEKTARSIS